MRPASPAPIQPIDDVLKARKGVCQDFAHVMIAICRGWGIPARYVSGYLFTDRKAGDRSDPDATHAWVEVFLPSLRWVGFDPTNNIIAGERHIVCAVGRDYSDVPPSRGVYKGEAESELAVGVHGAQGPRGRLRAGVPAHLPAGAPARPAPRASIRAWPTTSSVSNSSRGRCGGKAFLRRRLDPSSNTGPKWRAEGPS